MISQEAQMLIDIVQSAAILVLQFIVFVDVVAKK